MAKEVVNVMANMVVQIVVKDMEKVMVKVKGIGALLTLSSRLSAHDPQLSILVSWLLALGTGRRILAIDSSN